MVLNTHNRILGTEKVLIRLEIYSCAKWMLHIRIRYVNLKIKF